MTYRNCLEQHGRDVLVGVRPTQEAAGVFMRTLRDRFAERGIASLYFIYSASENDGDCYIWFHVMEDPDAVRPGAGDADRGEPDRARVRSAQR